MNWRQPFAARAIQYLERWAFPAEPRSSLTKADIQLLVAKEAQAIVHTAGTLGSGPSHEDVVRNAHIQLKARGIAELCDAWRANPR